MASHGEEELEYESDPEEANLSLGIRRREAASDDEEGERDLSVEKHEMNRRPLVDSVELDSLDGAADYYESEEEEEYIEDEEEYLEEYEEYLMDYAEEEELKKDGKRESVNGGASISTSAVMEQVVMDGGMGNVDDAAEEVHVGDTVKEEDEKKQNQQFSVPTAGAFYMHDDRFSEDTGGKQRRTFAGKKLWESRDDRKWGHDKFEEMYLHENHYEEGGRRYRGYRGRGRNQGPDHEFGRGNHSRAYNNGKNNDNRPKSVRGRGPRRFDSNTKHSTQAHPLQKKQYWRPLEKQLPNNSGKSPMPITLTIKSEPPAGKQVFASNLSSASPPFYPSGSSIKDVAFENKKREMETGSLSYSNRPRGINESSFVQQSNPMIQGKKVADSDEMENPYNSNFIKTSASKPQGRRGSILRQMAYRPKQSPLQNQGSKFVPSSAHQSDHQIGTGSETSSLPKTSLFMRAHEYGEVESSKPLVAKGNNNSVQGSGRGSFTYIGSQAVGPTENIGAGRGDQNFPGTSTFLPVMQFGGQNPGGIDVPTVGMAFPGYVANSHVSGNPAMTWLPFLAGAAGALGATYCRPYIALNGDYGRASPQTFSMESLRVSNSNEDNNDVKHSQGRPELRNDELSHQQNKPPRRYSEMNFSQSNK